MNEMNILSLSNELSKYGVIMSFTGPFSQGIIEEIGDALRNYLKSKDSSKGKTFKVFSVFIEQTQNIKNYAFSLQNEEEQEEILLSGILNIGVQNDVYFVSSGNYVKKENSLDLEKQLKTISSYTKKELAQAYKEKLHSSGSDEAGAGIGLLEMAKKSSDDIYFSFEEVNEKYNFFTLTIRI